MEPKDAVLARLKAIRIVRSLEIDFRLSAIEYMLRSYILSSFHKILTGNPPGTLFDYSPDDYSDYAALYGIEKFHEKLPDISELGLAWYIRGEDIFVGVSEPLIEEAGLKSNEDAEGDEGMEYKWEW
ncbi:MAG TPA: hypothetical protein EYP19_06540 [Desulfobacterales bacterium]|nr:hypothetical protein [Desulfobacterales bacterium]